MQCPVLRFSRHAFERMFARGVSPADVAAVVARGEVIAEYPEDRPYPSVLILSFVAGQPVHAVVAYDKECEACYVVTVYRPDPALWSGDFKSRRPT